MASHHLQCEITLHLRKKSLAWFNFSFLCLPCIYKHIYFLTGLFLLHLQSVLYTPGENRHSPLPSEQTQRGIRERSFLRVCSSASFITDWIPAEGKRESAAPAALNTPCHGRSQQNKRVTFLSPDSSRSKRGLQTVEGKCGSYIDFFFFSLNDLKGVQLERLSWATEIISMAKWTKKPRTLDSALPSDTGTVRFSEWFYTSDSFHSLPWAEVKNLCAMGTTLHLKREFLCLYIPFPNATTSKDKSYSYSDVNIGIPHSLEPFSSRLVRWSLLAKAEGHRCLQD